MTGQELEPWGRPGLPAKRTNYDTINGGPPIQSINGATKKGDSGYHDPYQAPPPGFNDWHEVGRQNQASLDAASIRGDALRRAGFRYNRSNGTWTAPDGRSTTLFGIDSGPPGGVDYHWDAGQENDPYAQPTSERQQMQDAHSTDPRQAYDYDSEVEDEGGLTGAFTKYTVWGRLLNLVDRWQKR